MQQNLFRAALAALAFVIAAAASTVAEARHVHHHKVREAPPRTDYLRYSYSYFPVLGFTRYENCYWVEDFAPYRPHLVRECPAR